MERNVRIGIRLLFSCHFYNKFSVPLYLSVGSRYMLEGQKLKRNVKSQSSRDQLIPGSSPQEGRAWERDWLHLMIFKTMFAQYRTNTQIRSVPFVTQEFLGLAVFEFVQFHASNVNAWGDSREIVSMVQNSFSSVWRRVDWAIIIPTMSKSKYYRIY
jgi:hypothetical protein